MGDWCTIESDPGIFTELISEMGVKDVQVEEVWSFDQESIELLESMQPVYGLIFLFKWKQEQDTRLTLNDFDYNEIFFANQVINNACATQAIVSILLNTKEIELGEVLSSFKDFTSSFPPEMRGLALSNSEKIRTAHNSFARPEPFVSGKKVKATEADDVYHFISYLPIGNKIYELDGLKEGPIFLANIPDGQSWIRSVWPSIQERISRYSESDLFNLMAIIKTKKTVYLSEIEELKMRKNILTSQIQNNNANQASDAMNVDSDHLNNEIDLIDYKISALSEKILEEEEKFRAWKVENTRRKHNYIPFIVNLLRNLADKGELVPLIEKYNSKSSK